LEVAVAGSDFTSAEGNSGTAANAVIFNYCPDAGFDLASELTVLQLKLLSTRASH